MPYNEALEMELFLNSNRTNTEEYMVKLQYRAGRVGTYVITTCDERGS